MSTFRDKLREREKQPGYTDDEAFMAGAIAALELVATLIDEHNAQRDYSPEYWNGKERARLMGIKQDQRELANQLRTLASSLSPASEREGGG